MLVLLKKRLPCTRYESITEDFKWLNLKGDFINHTLNPYRYSGFLEICDKNRSRLTLENGFYVIPFWIIPGTYMYM